MKILHVSKLSLSVIISVLILQTAIGPLAVRPYSNSTFSSYAYADDAPTGPSNGASPQSNPTSDQSNPGIIINSTEADLLKLQSELQEATLETPVKAANLAHLANQERLIWDETGENVVASYDLNKPDISIPERKIINLFTQLKIVYSTKKRELYIHFIMKKGDRKIITDTHVIKDIQVIQPTSTNGSIVMDNNSLFILTEKGLVEIPIESLKSDAFVRPLFAPVVLPVSAFGDPSKTKLANPHFINRDSEPKRYVRHTGEAVPEEFQGSDLGLEVIQDGISKNVWLSRELLANQLARSWIALVLLMQIRSPDTENMVAIHGFFKEHADRVAEQFQMVEKTLTASNNELLLDAVATMTQRSGVSGQIARLQKVMDANSTKRDAFGSDPSEGSQWQQDFARIQAARKAAVLAGKQPGISWQEILSSKLSEELAQLQPEELPSSRTIRGQFFSGAKKLFNQLKGRKQLAVIASTLAGTYVAGQLGVPGADQLAHFMATAASRLYEIITTTPYIPGDIKEAFTNLPKYLQNSGSLTRWLIGTTLLTSLYPLTVLASWTYSAIKNRALPSLMEGAKPLFNGMVKTYLWLNRVMELPWVIARQKNLYPAVLDHDVPVFQKGVFAKPGGIKAIREGLMPWQPTDEELERNHQLLNESLNDRAALNRLATRLAAATIVAEKTGIDVATLLQQAANLDKKTVELILNNDAMVQAEWAQLTIKIHEAAAHIIKTEDIELDADKLESDHKFYSKVAEKIKQESASQPGVLKSLLHRFAATCKMGARNLFKYFLGGSGRSIFNEMYHIEVSEKATAISFKQGMTDFTVSQLIWAGAVPSSFAFPGEGRIWAGVTEQIPAWQGVNTVDVSATVTAQEGSQSVAKPIGFSDLKPEVRPQTVAEAITTVLEKSLDTRSPEEKGYKNFFESWLQYLTNIKNGIFVRTILIGTPLYFMQFLTNETTPHLLGVYAAVSTALYILLSKYSFRMTPADNNIAPGLEQKIPGYAIVWPLVTSTTNMAKVTAENNARKLDEAAADIIRGIERGDIEILRKGVQAMKGLFSEGGAELPDELNIASSAYDFELSKKLLALAINSPPLPTEGSQVFEIANNILIGAILSTILYNGVQGPLVNRGGASLLELGYVLGTAFLVAKGIQVGHNYVIKPTLSVLNRFVVNPLKRLWNNYGVRDACALFLKARQPVNVE